MNNNNKIPPKDSILLLGMTIGDIKFTPREVDIIACILSGRSIKTIASFLSIAPRTAETHVRNIMRKLECNSQEGIRDYIEKSNRFSEIKQHYLNLLVEADFKKLLREISSKIKPISYTVIFSKRAEGASEFLERLKGHLKIMGAKGPEGAKNTIIEKDTIVQAAAGLKDDYILFVLTEEECSAYYSLKNNEVQQAVSLPSNLIFLVQSENPDQELSKKIEGIKYVVFYGCQDYYSSVLSIFQELFYLDDFDDKVTKFKKLYESNMSTIGRDSHWSFLEREEAGITQAKSYQGQVIRDKKVYLKLALAMGIVVLGFLSTKELYWGKTNSENTSNESNMTIRSDLSIPTDKTLLIRPKLLTQMQSFIKENDQIQTIALIGAGGAGKTVLARQYARTQEASVIWELNSSTKSTLVNSWEALGYALCNTDAERRELKSLISTLNYGNKEQELVKFVRKRLKVHSNWILIYDNVEKFNDILSHFPSQETLWGKGRVIITTQDANIHNSSYIQNTLLVRELTPDEKWSLFNKIMPVAKGENVALEQQSARKMLDSIPSFPLDVSLAAYYIRSTNVGYDQYLKYLSNYDHEFSALQENILKESNDYTKTRYHIITLSLNKLIATNTKFVDLLFLISILDFKEIPRGLLEEYKGKLVVDNLFYYLNKYSLITHSKSQPIVPITHISVHQSTQNISFLHLSNILKLNNNAQIVGEVGLVLDSYLNQTIEKEDIPKMKSMIVHLEGALGHSELFTDFLRGLLESKLACLYYYVNDPRSNQLIKSSLAKIHTINKRQLSPVDKLRVARSLVIVGDISTELRHYKEAKDCLEQAVKIYDEGDLNSRIERSWALSNLGNLYRRLGEYEKARSYLEESIGLRRNIRTRDKCFVHTLACLGSVHRGLGNYQKSIGFLEESLALANRLYPKGHYRIGRILRSLGNVYRKEGSYKKAKKFLEESLLIYKRNFPANHMSIGLALAYLGNCLREVGEYEKSCLYLEQSLKIHENQLHQNQAKIGWLLYHLGTTYKALGRNRETHRVFHRALKILDSNLEGDTIETAHLLRYMAEIYMVLNQLNEAEVKINRSLEILKNNNHISIYRSHELLGQIYLEKARNTKNIKEIQEFKSEAIKQLNIALRIVRERLPQNSIYLGRILSKLKNI